MFAQRSLLLLARDHSCRGRRRWKRVKKLSPDRPVERDHILEVVTNWRIEGSDGAAALLNFNPSTLRSRMKKLGVQRSTQAVS